MLSRLLPIRQSIGNISSVRKFSAATNKLIDVTNNQNTGIDTLTLQNPPINSFNPEFIQQLHTALDELEKNKSRGVIITSSNKVFCAGLDLSEIINPNYNRLKEIWSSAQDLWLKLYTSTYPTVAVINGHGPGGGSLIALACEYRIITGEKYLLGLNETKVGLPVPRWVVDILASAIGIRQAELAVTSGKLYTGAESLKLGLVDELVSSKEEGLLRAEEFLSLFKSTPDHARKHTKLAARDAVINLMKTNRESDLKTFLGFLTEPSVQNAIQSFFQPKKK